MTKKMQQNIIFMVLLAGGVLYVFTSYLYGPLNDRYEQASTQITQTQNTLREMKRRALELPKLTAEMNLLQAEVADLESLLPREKEIPGLLRTVTETAQHYRLKVSNFTPAAVASQANYNEVPFQLTMHGSFHGLAHFLAEIGQEQRILSARNVTVAANPSFKEAEGDSVNANFTLIAYTFKQ